MFDKSAAYYDLIYEAQGKDYAAEARKVHAVLEAKLRRGGNSLLDVGCGTGGHLPVLSERWDVSGLDLDGGMLDVARGRCPGIPLYEADMAGFELPRRFDAIVCLFGSVGYVRTEERLRAAIGRMAAHLETGGVLLVEPWLGPDTFQPGRLHAAFVDRPDLKLARMSRSTLEGGLSVIEFHYLVSTAAGVEHFTERHLLGLFTGEQYLMAFEAVGLETRRDPVGLDGRGLYIGVKVRPTSRPRDSAI